MPTPPTSAYSKAALRKTLLARRLAQPAAVASAFSHCAQAALMAHSCWHTASCVALYMPVRGEVDTRLLREDAWARRMHLLLPRCRVHSGQMDFVMDFVLCQGEHDTAPGAYGILEPAAHLPAQTFIAGDANACPPDIIVLPGVAYDRQGRRLGFGGGYYDRVLAQPALSKSLRVGLAFAWQIVDALPADPWDYSVHCLCTEEGLQWL